MLTDALAVGVVGIDKLSGSWAGANDTFASCRPAQRSAMLVVTKTVMMIVLKKIKQCQCSLVVMLILMAYMAQFLDKNTQ